MLVRLPAMTGDQVVRPGPMQRRPIVLNPDDVPAFPDPPAGIDAEKDVPHVWHVDGNAHDPTEWRNNLWLFAQRIFR